MLKPALPALALMLAAMPLLGGSAAVAAPSATDASARHPTVIELFQSQGCSSCPPANALLNAMVDRPDVLALSFAVTYWDQLGWKDSFGSPRFTARQQDYASAGLGEVATPEFIVNGAYPVLGSDRGALAAAVARAGAAHAGTVDAGTVAGTPDITVTGQTLSLGAAMMSAPATVWLVRYDPRTRNVPIRAGENSGRTLPHRDIVRDLVKLGVWAGPAATFALPAAHEAGLISAVLVQRGAGGPIIAASRI